MEDDTSNPEPNNDEEKLDSSYYDNWLSEQDKDMKRWVKKYNKKHDYQYNHYSEWDKIHTQEPKKAIYEEIVDDLIAIIAKLAKELGKKK